jgi:hypothetical protein
MTTPTLNKIEATDDPTLWTTDNYALIPCDSGQDAGFGYDIINVETGQVELRIDQEPQGVMAMLWLQEQYEEVMGDPSREFQRRKPSTSGLTRAAAGPRVIN